MRDVDVAHESQHLLLVRVNGKPTPQGSKRAVIHNRTHKPVVMESAGDKLRYWREDVRNAVSAAIRRTGYETASGPIEVRVLFSLQRPTSHYRTGRNRHLIRNGAPTHPQGKPDLDKLLRSTFDAISSAGAWLDDAQVVSVHAWKLYAVQGEMPGAAITIRQIVSAPMEVDE